MLEDEEVMTRGDLALGKKAAEASFDSRRMKASPTDSTALGLLLLLLVHP